MKHQVGFAAQWLIDGIDGTHDHSAYQWDDTMKRIVILLLISFTANAQVNRDSDLFKDLKRQDSTFFERSFNQCDVVYLKNHTMDDLKFYHDQSGFQDKTAFLKNIQTYICHGGANKPIRHVDAGSLQVFPLYNQGKLYGAIQHGIHYFYLREKGKEDVHTSTAKFTHVWVLDNGAWKLSEALSYDHFQPASNNGR